MIKYSCSKPNQKSSSGSFIFEREFDSCGVPSAFMTSVITKKPSVLAGSGYMATGFNRQSDEPPNACLVELPSKDHSSQSSNLPPKSSTTFVLLLRLAVGS